MENLNIDNKYINNEKQGVIKENTKFDEKDTEEQEIKKKLNDLLSKISIDLMFCSIACHKTFNGAFLNGEHPADFFPRETVFDISVEILRQCRYDWKDFGTKT